MDQEIKKLKNLAKTMRKEGVLTYKTPQIEISLSPYAIEPMREKPATTGLLKDVTHATNPQFDSQDTLLWSAPGAEEEEINVT